MMEQRNKLAAGLNRMLNRKLSMAWERWQEWYEQQRLGINIVLQMKQFKIRRAVTQWGWCRRMTLGAREKRQQGPYEYRQTLEGAQRCLTFYGEVMAVADDRAERIDARRARRFSTVKPLPNDINAFISDGQKTWGRPLMQTPRDIDSPNTHYSYKEITTPR